MKLTQNILCKSLIALLVFTFSFSLAPKSIHANEVNSNILVVDTNKNTDLPSKFRNIKSLNISGSAQYLPSQVPKLITELTAKDLIIVDLRQESHGFINNIAVSFYNKQNPVNNGLSSSKVMTAEKSDFKGIPLGKEISLYHKNGDLNMNVTANSVFTESQVLKAYNIKYARFSVRDGHIPTPEVVDEFVSFVKSLPPNAHLHFHCKEGEGRTTTFMSLYQMMKNKDNMSLDDILSYQIENGGVELTDSETRAELLNNFYKYTKAVSSNNFKTPYSAWIKVNS